MNTTDYDSERKKSGAFNQDSGGAEKELNSNGSEVLTETILIKVMYYTK